MSRSAKILLLSLIVVVNAAIWWWRYQHETIDIPGVGPQIAALGKAQADTVLAWRQAASVPLTPTSIQEFAAHLAWKNCEPLAAAATVLNQRELAADQQQDLRDAVAGLIRALSRDDPAELFDYMTARGEQLSPTGVTTLQQLLVKDGNLTPSSVESRSPRELFLLVSQKAHYRTHWESLAADTGCITIWRTNIDRGRVAEEIPLGATSAGLFKNQTRFHHLFQPKDGPATSDTEVDTTFADVRFVVNHDAELMTEPSLYHVRFRWYPSTHDWHPVEMIHVATISGSSPVLLF